jgi:coproporphyrinogen III oxidase-like Fe-S oxidoreductase
LLVGFDVERVIDANVLLAASAKGGKQTKQEHSQQAKTGKKATAKEALDSARKAFAAMIKAARLDEGLDLTVPKNKPFWAATKKLDAQLKRAQTGLAAKNDEFFSAISDARGAEEQMKIDWQPTD